MRFLVTQFFLVLLLTYSKGYCISNNYSKVRLELSKKIELSSDPSLTILDYTSEFVHEGYFKEHDEWVRSMYFIDTLISPYKNENTLATYTIISRRLQVADEFQKAYYFLYKANDLSKSVSIRQEKIKREFNDANGYSSLYFRQYNDAKQRFLNALKIPGLNYQDSIEYLNNLGLIHAFLNDPNQSNIYYRQGLKIAKKHNIKEWIALLSGNMGVNYHKIGDLQKAKSLLNTDYYFSTLTGQIESVISTLNLLISIDIMEGKLVDARIKFSELETLVKQEEKTATRKCLYQSKSELLEAEGDYKGALQAFQLLTKTLDTLNQKKQMADLFKTEFQIDFEKETGKVKLLEEKKKRSDILIYGLFILIILSIVSFIVIIYQISKRRIQEAKIALKDKEELDKELQRSEKEMHKILENLMRKNEVIELLNSELEIVQSLNIQETTFEKQKIKDKLQSFTLLTEDDWIEFKRLFEFLNPDFLQKIQVEFHELTNAEIRLITLIKLNLSNNEMAKALGISPDSVRKTNLRLRKKLEIEEQEDLLKFVLSI